MSDSKKTDFKKVSDDVKTVPNALYFVVHRDGFCEKHKWSGYTLMNKHTDQKCGSRAHTLLQNVEQHDAEHKNVIVTFHDNNDNELGLYLEIDKKEADRIGNNAYDIARRYLDSTAKFKVVSVLVGPHFKVGMAIYLGVETNGYVEEVFIHKIEADSNTTPAEVMGSVESIKTNPYYGRYDLSGITVDKIRIEKPVKLCNIF